MSLRRSFRASPVGPGAVYLTLRERIHAAYAGKSHLAVRGGRSVGDTLAEKRLAYRSSIRKERRWR
jgi:hypothetical protein